MMGIEWLTVSDKQADSGRLQCWSSLLETQTPGGDPRLPTLAHSSRQKIPITEALVRYETLRGGGTSEAYQTTGRWKTNIPREISLIIIARSNSLRSSPLWCGQTSGSSSRFLPSWAWSASGWKRAMLSTRRSTKRSTMLGKSTSRRAKSARPTFWDSQFVQDLLWRRTFSWPGRKYWIKWDRWK